MSAKSLVMAVLLMASSLASAEPMLKLDFDTPRLQQEMLTGDLSQKVVAPRGDADVKLAGDALAVERYRKTLAAGERWAVTRLRVDTAKYPNATLSVGLYALGEDKPVASAETKMTANRVWAWADLRQANLAAARLKVIVRDGDKTVGATELLLSATPVTPLADGQRVAISVDVPKGLTLVDGQTPVTFGFPLPEGAAWDDSRLRVVNGAGQPVPFQKQVTGKWNKGGAVQWVRFDALVKPGEGVFVENATAAAPPAPASPVKVTQDGDRVLLETAGVSYLLGAETSPIQEIRLGKQPIATAVGARGLYVVDQTGRVGTASAKDATVLVESAGPVAASVRIEGNYADPAGTPIARHITRVELFAGQPQANITHTLVLIHDSNEVWLKEVGWAMKTSVGGSAAALFNRSRENPAEVVEQSLRNGEQAWMIQDQHMRYQAGQNHFAIAKQASGGPASVLAEGDECGDWAALKGSGAMVVIGCREAARQHPKEFAFTSDGFDLKLFSARTGEELDFRVETRMKIWNISNWLDSGAVPKTRREGAEDRIRKIPSNAAGWSKTHELTVAALPASAASADAARVGQANGQGVFAHADPKWTYQTRVFGPLHPRDPERFAAEEKLLDQTIAWWLGRGAHVGEWGFVDAFSGPHMAYRGSAGFPLMRRFPLTYTLRRDLWMLYARSGDRNIRTAAADSVRAFMDGCMARWDTDTKVRGNYISEGDGANWSLTSTPESVPMYWQGRSTWQTGTTSDLDTFAWYYHLTGYRRAGEAVKEYAEALTKHWTPAVNRKEYRSMRLLIQQAQCYLFTEDERFRIMAEDLIDVLYEPTGSLFINRDKPYGAGYKMQSDSTVVDVVARILRDERAEQMRDAVMAFYPNQFLAQHPYAYSFPMGLIANWQYETTGDPAMALGGMLSNRMAARSYDPATATFGRMGLISPFMRGLFEGIPYHQHLIAQTDADRKTVASWAAFEVGDQPITIVLRKDAPRDSIYLRLVNPQPIPQIGQQGATAMLQVLKNERGAAGAPTMLCFNEVASGPYETTHVRVPIDAPEGVYAVSKLAKGQLTVIADRVTPMVVEAPEGLKPSVVVDRVYFKVPDGGGKARVLAEGSATLLGPDGKAVGEPFTGWKDLPANQPGMWGLQLHEPKKIAVEGIPPYFTFNDPTLYFDVPARQAAAGGAEAD